MNEQTIYKSAAVVGISQGGWTAVKFAVAFLERVARMIRIRRIITGKNSLKSRTIPFHLSNPCFIFAL